jgi:hypothetical protein
MVVIRDVPNVKRTATVKRALFIVTLTLAHFALTLGAVALALWFMREPACSGDDECDCTDDCRAVVFKVEAANRVFRSTAGSTPRVV